MSIQYFTQSVSFKIPHPRKTSNWVQLAFKKEKKCLTALSYVFCSDEDLLPLNQEYLRHNTLTDIITFDLSESKEEIQGEIYISIERVRENALKFKREFDEELHRVIIHGALHLMGYKDKKPPEKVMMREKEEAYLSLRKVPRGTRGH